MKKILVLFIGLFIMVNGAVFAQETDDKDESQDVVTGSVSVSEFYYFPTEGNPGEIQLMVSQGGVEATSRFDWQYVPGSCFGFNCWIQGKANTRITTNTILIRICVRIVLMLGHNTNFGVTGENCHTGYTGSVEVQKLVHIMRYQLIAYGNQ
ncbi:MAG: hypothetical protein MUE54_01270 [Anaerolineae bacterium]|nr:hypothetical protein [Anaerolineae bacterium]